MNDNLKDAYRKTGDRVAPLGDVDRAITIARRRRARYRAAVPVAVAALVAAITVVASGTPWSDRAEPSSRTERPDSTDPALEQDLLPKPGENGAPYLPSRAPRSASFPPATATPLMADPPGRAVVAMTQSESAVDPYYAYRGFDDIDQYFYGVDGRWRSLNLADLGIDADDFSSDAHRGQLSPDGRYWAFRTSTRIAIVDLETAELRLFETDGRQLIGFPWFLPDGSLLMGQGGATEESRQWTWELIDPGSGERRVWGGPPIERMSFRADGTSVRFRGQPDSRVMVEFGTDGRPEGTTEIPFGLDGQAWAWFTDDRIALIATVGIDANGPRARMDDVVVTDRDAKPEAVLTRSHQATPVGWIDDATLLLYGDDRLLAWRPGQARMYTISRHDGDASFAVAVDAVLDLP